MFSLLAILGPPIIAVRPSTPPLLPLSLCLVVSYLLWAERNLSRYLYDYD